MSAGDAEAEQPGDGAIEARLLTAASSVEGILPGIIYIADAADWSRTLYVSPSIEPSLGYSAAEWVANPRLFADQLHPDDADRVAAEAASSLVSGKPFRCEYRLRSRGGHDTWFRDEAIITCDESGTPRWRQGVMLRRGDRNDIEAEVVTRRLAEMAETNEILLNATGNLTRTLQLVAERARTLTGADFAAVSTFAEDGSVERFIYAGLDDQTAQAIGNLPVGRGLLGRLRQAHQPVRIEELDSDPRFTGFPPAHPPMSAFLGVPIHPDGVTIGSLYMTRKPGEPPFSATDELSATLLALHTAIRIKDAMAAEHLGRVALLAERGRIAHDLHDGTIQVLYAMGLESDSVAMRADLPADVRDLFREHVRRINELIGDIRGYIQLLEAEAPDGPPELSRDLAYVARQIIPAGIDTVLNIKAAALQEIGAREAEDVLFVTREALSNAVRHGSPTRIGIDVRQLADETVLTIQDNGVGFEPLGARMGLGTVTMRTRAERLGADLTIISIPGMGTTVRLRLPRMNDD